MFTEMTKPSIATFVIVICAITSTTFANAVDVMTQMRCLGSQRFNPTIACGGPDIIHVARAYYGVRNPGTAIDCHNPDIYSTDCRSSSTELTADFRGYCNTYGACSKLVETVDNITLECNEDFNDGQSYIYVEHLCLPVTPIEEIVNPMDSTENNVMHIAAQVQLRSANYPTQRATIQNQVCEVSLPLEATLLVQVLQFSSEPNQVQRSFCLSIGTQYLRCSSSDIAYETRQITPLFQQTVFLRFSPSTLVGTVTGQYWLILKAEGSVDNPTLTVTCGNNARNNWRTTQANAGRDLGETSTDPSHDMTTPPVEPSDKPFYMDLKIVIPSSIGITITLGLTLYCCRKCGCVCCNNCSCC